MINNPYKNTNLESKLFLNSFLFLITILLFSSCAAMLDTSYEERDFEFSNQDMPSEPGKCYAKCLIPDKYEYFEKELTIYTGENTDREGVVLETIAIKPATKKWEKKKNDDCKSADPNDCLVWCLIDIPEITEDYYLVIDTSIVKEYTVEKVNYAERVRTGGFTEWREVVCAVDVTKRFYLNVQMALIEKGYGESVVPDGKISKSTKEALVRCQKENSLPVGSLDIETLQFLGVEY